MAGAYLPLRAAILTGMNPVPLLRAARACCIRVVHKTMRLTQQLAAGLDISVDRGFKIAAERFPPERRFNVED